MWATGLTWFCSNYLILSQDNWACSDGEDWKGEGGNAQASWSLGSELAHWSSTAFHWSKAATRPMGGAVRSHWKGLGSGRGEELGDFCHPSITAIKLWFCLCLVGDDPRKYQEGVRKVSQGREESQSRCAEQIIAEEWGDLSCNSSGDLRRQWEICLSEFAYPRGEETGIFFHRFPFILRLVSWSIDSQHILFDSGYFAWWTVSWKGVGGGWVFYPGQAEADPRQQA